MQVYDLAMVIVLVGATLFGAWKGMAWQIASLTSIILSYFVALNFAGELAPLLSDEEPWNKFLAMLVLYLGTALVVWLAFRVVSSMIERVRLKEFDRQVGGLFGAAKGVVLCVAITFFAVTLSEKSRELVLESRSGDYIARLIAKADPIMPEELHGVLDPYLGRLERELQPARGAQRAAESKTATKPAAESAADSDTGGRTATKPAATPSRPPRAIRR